MPMPSAPPEPPSPITTQMIGLRIWLMAIRFSAMIAAWPRSSAEMPG